MVKARMEIFWKDLLKSTQKRIKKFYDKYGVTGLETIYDNQNPIIVLMVFDEGDLIDRTAMDGMVS